MTTRLDLLGEYITICIRDIDVSKLKDGETIEIKIPGTNGIRYAVNNLMILHAWEEGKGYVPVRPSSASPTLLNIKNWFEAYDRLELITTIQKWSPSFVSDVNFKMAEEHTGFDFKFMLTCDLKLLRNVVKTLISKS